MLDLMLGWTSQTWIDPKCMTMEEKKKCGDKIPHIGDKIPQSRKRLNKGGETQGKMLENQRAQKAK